VAGDGVGVVVVGPGARRLGQRQPRGGLGAADLRAQEGQRARVAERGQGADRRAALSVGALGALQDRQVVDQRLGVLQGIGGLGPRRRQRLYLGLERPQVSGRGAARFGRRGLLLSQRDEGGEEEKNDSSKPGARRGAQRRKSIT
jgi:hypothetical protein